MSDQLSRRPVLGDELNQDGLYQQLALLAVQACSWWAHAELDPMLGVLLWPRDRGPVAGQAEPMRVTTRVVEHGVWNVTLCPADRLPPGVDPGTRDAIVRAQVAGDAYLVPPPAIDQLVQAGLFREVFYR